MSYTSTLVTFPTSFIVASTALWYTPAGLRLITQILNSVYFPISDSRSQAFESINQILAPTPFSQTVRFPSPGVYVSTLDPQLLRILSQLCSALSYKDRLLEKTTIEKTTVSVSSNTPYYLAALHSFTAAKLAFNLYITNYINYYDRFVFESTYSLTWNP
jgi:hypothetical protein